MHFKNQSYSYCIARIGMFTTDEYTIENMTAGDRVQLVKALERSALGQKPIQKSST